MRGLTLEELRAFLTSVLVNPARSRNWIGWIRSWRVDRTKTEAVVVAKGDEPAPTSTGTQVAK